MTSVLGWSNICKHTQECLKCSTWVDSMTLIKKTLNVGRNAAAYFVTASMTKTKIMDKLQVKGQNMGRVFNSRSGCTCPIHLSCYEAKLPNLKLKTRLKQLLGSLSCWIWHSLQNESWYWQRERRQNRDIKGCKVWTIVIHSLQLRTSG